MGGEGDILVAREQHVAAAAAAAVTGAAPAACCTAAPLRGYFNFDKQSDPDTAACS